MLAVIIIFSIFLLNLVLKWIVSKACEKMRKFSVCGIKNHRTAAVRGAHARCPPLDPLVGRVCYILLNSWVLLLIRSYFIKYLVVGYFLFQIFINHVLFINKNQICQDITLLNLEIVDCFDCVKPPYWKQCPFWVVGSDWFIKGQCIVNLRLL